MGSLTYEAALAALQERGRFGIRLGLGRTRALLHEMGDPQLSFRGALVGGTNGKGSVLALVTSAMRAAGLRPGETPKPHLVTYRERLQIAGRLVEPVAFAGIVEAALEASDRIAGRYGAPTEFELLTAAAFRWFADEAVDLAVVEVGLGGRLDATHAWDGGVAAITNVDLDHMEHLGPTVSAIAREKAAIIVRGDLAVTGATGEGLAVIRRRAGRLGVPLRIAPRAELLGFDRDGIVVELAGLGPTRVGLRGRHQAANVAVAESILDALEEAGIALVPSAARRDGYAGARWPGRLELIETSGHEILLDGAHNPAGAAVLARALDDLRPFLAGGSERVPPPMTLVIGAMADKDVAGIVAALARSASLGAGRVIATQIALPRALPAEGLAALWTGAAGSAAVSGAGPTVRVVRPPSAALALALAEAPGPIVVAGSLYLVGEIRALLLDDQALSDRPGARP